MPPSARYDSFHSFVSHQLDSPSHHACVDEDKYVKVLMYDEDTKKLKTVKEYFVSQTFGMNEDLNTLEQFHYSNGLLYNNTDSYVLQERGTETESIQIAIKVDTFKQNPASFPLCSDQFILKLIDRDANPYGFGFGYGGVPNQNRENKNYELYLAPPLNSRKIVNAPEWSGYIEFFLHSDDSIIIRMNYINGYANINMVNQNGLIFDSLIMNVNPG